jgi:hypothetical protein
MGTGTGRLRADEYLPPLLILALGRDNRGGSARARGARPLSRPDEGMNWTDT